MTVFRPDTWLLSSPMDPTTWRSTQDHGYIRQSRVVCASISVGGGHLGRCGCESSRTTIRQSAADFLVCRLGQIVGRTCHALCVANPEVLHLRTLALMHLLHKSSQSLPKLAATLAASVLCLSMGWGQVRINNRSFEVSEGLPTATGQFTAGFLEMQAAFQRLRISITPQDKELAICRKRRWPRSIHSKEMRWQVSLPTQKKRSPDTNTLWGRFPIHLKWGKNTE